MLRSHPDLAQEIGLLIADYAALDYFLFEAYALISTDPPEASFSRYYGLRSINNRTELVMAGASQLRPNYHRAFKRLCRRLKGAATRRTEIAHAFIWTGEKGVGRLFLFGDSARIEPLTEAFLARTLSQFRILGADILSLGGVLSHHLPDRAAQLEASLNAGPREQLHWKPDPLGLEEPPPEESLDASLTRLGLDPQPWLSPFLPTYPSGEDPHIGVAPN